MQPIILEIKVYGGSDKKILVDREWSYLDVDYMEMANDMLAYRIAEIARAEIVKIRKAQFIKDNPELYSDVVVDNSEPF